MAGLREEVLGVDAEINLYVLILATVFLMPWSKLQRIQSLSLVIVRSFIAWIVDDDKRK